MPGWVSYLALQASLADRNQLFYRKGYFEYVLPLIRVGVVGSIDTIQLRDIQVYDRTHQLPPT